MRTFNIDFKLIGHILNWLTSTDYGPQQSDFFKRRQQGTGEWFLASEPYLTWLNQGNQTLFCPGIPGAGKTIITSIVINDLLDRFRNEVTVGIAYIYFNFRRNDEQDISHLLASILKQLVQGQSSLPEGIQKLYNTHETQRTRPSDDEILQATRSVATTYSQVFVILDALDECQITDARRSKFLSVIFNLQTATEVNLFATSRPIQDIKQQFQDCITQEILASDGDIGRYVQGHMSELPGFILGRPDIQQEIKEGIIKAVNGMYDF